MDKPKIAYFGPEDQKRAGGELWKRGVYRETTPEKAGTLTEPSPRVFYYEGEEVPAHLEDEYLYYPDRLIEHDKAHARQYDLIAAQYTDEEDVLRKEGAEGEVQRTQERIAEHEAMRAARRKAATKEQLASADKAHADLKRRLETQRVQRIQRERSLQAKKKAQFSHLPGGMGVDPTLAGI